MHAVTLSAFSHAVEAKRLGINYAPDARGQFAHSNLITVLNAEGEIAFRQPGLNGDPAALVAAIGKLFAPKRQ